MMLRKNKKYVMTNDIIKIGDSVLHRIKAIKDFGTVRKGELGGYIEKEANLSHDDKCWVYGDATVYGNALVYDNAKVFGNSSVCNYAEVYDNAKVHGDAYVYGNALVYGNANISGHAAIYDCSRVYGNAIVYDNAKVFDNSEICGNVCVGDHANVFGDVTVYGNAKILNDASISSDEHYITFGNVGSRFDTTTMFRGKVNSVLVTCGCFRGTLDEFRDKVIEEHGNNEYAKEYLAIIEVAKIHFNLI